MTYTSTLSPGSSSRRTNHCNTVVTPPTMPALPTDQQTQQQEEEQDDDLNLAYASALINNNATEEQTQRAQVLTNIPSNHLNKNFQPGSVHDVFKYNFTLAEGEYKNCEIVARNSVRKNVYPIIKFLWYDSPDEKEKNFNYIKEDLLQHGKEKELRKANPCAYEFLRGLNKLDQDTPAIDKAIFWNTYRKLVENTLSNQRSSDISLMKRNIVPGNENASFLIHSFNIQPSNQIYLPFCIMTMLEIAKSMRHQADADKSYPSKVENLRSVMNQIIADRKIEEGSSEFKEKQKKSADDGIEEICFPNFTPLFKNELAFQEFCDRVLCVVVGKVQMGTMGTRLVGTAKNCYLKAVTLSNEQFALMVLDDRWELWERLAELRLLREDDPNENGSNSAQQEDSIKKSIYHDEDDQRQQDATCKDPKANKIPGSNLTRYSMWGRYCPYYKGYGNGNPAMLAMNASLGGRQAPLRRSPDAVRLRKQISEWWGNEKYTGPKRKRKKEPRQMKVKKDKGPICQILTDDIDEEELYLREVGE